MRSGWRLLVWMVLLVPLLVGIVLGYRAYDRRLMDRSIQEARGQLQAGSPETARSRLIEAASRWPDEGEIFLLLGDCERRLGSPAAAEAAWSRVPVGSPFAAEAALALAREAIGDDRLADAEARLIPVGLEAPGALGVEAREHLIYLYKLQGRLVEARRLVRASWGVFPDPMTLIKESWRLDSNRPMQVEQQREVLERAAARHPDDDRVRLGRANLLLRIGRLDEAGHLLAEAVAKRPNDPAAQQARLEWAMASGNSVEAREALRRLPGDWFEPRESLRIRAWFASHSGDPARERQALSELIELDPSDIPALERLASLALQAGEADEAVRLRACKAELDALRDRYVALLRRREPGEGAAELARLAEQLGRWLEARGWWQLALQRDRDLLDEARTALDRIAKAEARQATGLSIEDLRTALDSERLAVRSSARRGSDRIASRPVFVEEAERAGLQFRYDPGQSARHQLPETMGSGVGLLDYDGDGWQDAYLVQGGAFPPDEARPSSGDRLFRNRGDGTFEDVTDAAGIAAMRPGYGHGVAVGDFDKDGHPDLFLTRWGSYALYRNRGDGTFEDVTEAAGLGGERDWPTSAVFADLDGDGDLDLYVCHYLEWDAENPPSCHQVRAGKRIHCLPVDLPARSDRLYRNDGGRFVDVSEESGIAGLKGRALGVVACDLDGDGSIDLYVTNDMTANFLWRNLGGLRFEEVGHESGVAGAASGAYQAGMGVACGDLDGNGLPDLAVTNFYAESTTLYLNLGGGIFGDQTSAAGLAARSRWVLGFGASFLDYDNDGHLDLATANGHIDDLRPDEPYAMPLQLFAGDGQGSLADQTERAGADWSRPRVARALAVGDLDNDGRPDALVTTLDGPLALLRNRTTGGRFLVLRLEGTDSDPDAIGARVTVTAGGRPRVASRIGGGSYQASSDPRMHFGLGSSERVEAVEVRWPSGRVEQFGPFEADTAWLLREGDPESRPLAGYARVRDEALDSAVGRGDSASGP